MKVTLGTYVIANGTLAGEPCRLLPGSSGSKDVQPSKRIRAAKAAIFGRGNRIYNDSVEADFSYATSQLAKAGLIARRVAALEATGTLVYGDGDDTTSIGPAEVQNVELVDWSGCGFTLKFQIICVEA